MEMEFEKDAESYVFHFRSIRYSVFVEWELTAFVMKSHKKLLIMPF